MFKERVDRHKVAARVSVANYERLKVLAAKYEFRTVNDLLSYLVYCFLRAVEGGNDELMYSMPEDILSLFPIDEDAHDVKAALARIKRKRLGRKKADEVDEIGEMFRECESQGGSMEYAHSIRERNER